MIANPVSYTSMGKLGGGGGGEGAVADLNKAQLMRENKRKLDDPRFAPW